MIRITRSTPLAVPDIPPQSERPEAAPACAMTLAAVLRWKDRYRDQRAAPFALEAWPFRAHRTLAETPFDNAQGR